MSTPTPEGVHIRLGATNQHPLTDLSVLDIFRTGSPYPPGYPGDVRTLYSPVDDVHGALGYLMAAAQHEILVAMFGFDDDTLAAVLRNRMQEPNVHVQLTLDKSQAGGVHERKLLETEGYPNTSVAIGSSEHGRIMHMKLLVIDGAVLVSGSTNWSGAAETLQDNELTVALNTARANEARLRITAIHRHMLAATQKEKPTP